MLAHVLIHAGIALILQKFVFPFLSFSCLAKSAVVRKTLAMKIAQVVMNVRSDAALQVLLRVSGRKVL